MSRVLSIGFSYFQKVYYTWIRVIEKPNRTEYHVTILDFELDRLLYGNNVFVENDGFLVPELYEDEAQGNLRLEITQALNDYLKSGKKIEQ